MPPGITSRSTWRRGSHRWVPATQPIARPKPIAKSALTATVVGLGRLTLPDTLLVSGRHSSLKFPAAPPVKPFRPEATLAPGAAENSASRTRNGAAVTEHAHSVTECFRLVTESFASVTENLRLVTDAFRSVTETFLSVTEYFRLVTEAFVSVTECFRSVTDAFRSVTELAFGDCPKNDLVRARIKPPARRGKLSAKPIKKAFGYHRKPC